MSVNGASQNYENTVDQNFDAESILKNSNANINANVDKEKVSPSAEVYDNHTPVKISLTARKISNDRPDNNLPIISNYLYLQFFHIIFLTINSNPPWQLTLWEEAGEPGENPRLSAEC